MQRRGKSNVMDYQFCGAMRNSFAVEDLVRSFIHSFSQSVIV